MRSIICFILALLNSVDAFAASKTNAADPRTEFSLNLFDSLQQAHGNIIFSPFSIHTALAMTGLGARGETARQLFRVLYGKDSPPAAVKDPAAVLPPDSPLKMANALWMQRGSTIEPMYQASVKSLFNSELVQVNFKSDPDQSRQQINRWVAGKTNGKIADLFGPRSITSASRVILVNAIYFKANWQNPFNPRATIDMAFAIDGNGADVKVPTMRASYEFPYFENADVQMIKLPYAATEDLSMEIILPKNRNGLPDLEKKLSNLR